MRNEVLVYRVRYKALMHGVKRPNNANLKNIRDPYAFDDMNYLPKF